MLIGTGCAGGTFRGPSANTTLTEIFVVGTVRAVFLLALTLLVVFLVQSDASLTF